MIDQCSISVFGVGTPAFRPGRKLAVSRAGCRGLAFTLAAEQHAAMSDKAQDLRSSIKEAPMT